MNLARFDLVSIRLAVYCCECGTLSEAAKRSFMTVSSASYRLASLEAALGQKLFVRTTVGLSPTQAGLALLLHGRALLRIVDDLANVFGAQRRNDFHAS